MHDRTSKALGTVETSNHSYQAKAPLKATRTKMNGTFLLKCLAAFCMLGNVTASPTPTCGCSEAISALRVEFQAKYDKQQALIDYVANEVQDVRECSACVSPSPPPPSPSPPPPSPSPPPLPSPPCACGDTCVVEGDMAGFCDAGGACSFDYLNLGCVVVASPPPSPPPPADCDCDFHAGGCSISEAAPEGKACKCVYKGAWTCGGDVVSCGNPASPKCTAPDKSVASCAMGGGDCGGYSGDQDCDCEYHSGGCTISKVAPKHTACECSYKGAFTCDGEVVQCRDDWDPLCLNPDFSPEACQLGGGDCDGY